MEGKKFQMFNTFQMPTNERSIVEGLKKQYKFYCWVPESVMSVGDTGIVFNSFEDLRYEFSPFIISYIIQNHTEN